MIGDQEFVAEMVYSAVWPNRDPDDETDDSFAAAIAIVPRAVRRRFGLGVLTPEDVAWADAERARLYAYTDFADGA